MGIYDHDFRPPSRDQFLPQNSLFIYGYSPGLLLPGDYPSEFEEEADRLAGAILAPRMIWPVLFLQPALNGAMQDDLLDTQLNPRGDIITQ